MLSAVAAFAAPTQNLLVMCSALLVSSGATLYAASIEAVLLKIGLHSTGLYTLVFLCSENQEINVQRLFPSHCGHSGNHVLLNFGRMKDCPLIKQNIIRLMP